MEKNAHEYYTQTISNDTGVHKGISVESNLYNLFIYRSLDYWCSVPIGENRPPGKLAFVIPLGFCASNNSADLRALFAPGGRWTITEIVDMELIWKHVFDARVLPMILFAEARPPKLDDKVTVRHVNESSVCHAILKRCARPIIDISVSPECSLNYADIFTPEGRIATRLTPTRVKIVKKLRSLGQFSEAAKRYWTKRKGGYKAVDVKPTGIGEAFWEEQRMISDGIARRGTGKENSDKGLDVYKGENIRTGSLVGNPQFKSLDVWNLSDASFWKFPDLLPARMWCLPIIEQIPCAAPFDPKKIAVANTATVFGPRPDLESFPFDMLLTSRIYGWITLLSLRSSYQDMLRSHMYHTTIGKLPWSETLISIATGLADLRDSFFSACRARYDAGAELERQSKALPLVSLKGAFKALTNKEDKLILSGAFDTGEEFVVSVQKTKEGEDPLVLVISEDAHSLTFPSLELENYARLGLGLVDGQEMSKTRLLNLPIPQDEVTAQTLRELIAQFDPLALEAEVDRKVDEIDDLVGAALDLTPEEVKTIQSDMSDDPFLRRVRPRYPHFNPALRGRRTSLESSARYV